MDIGQQLPEMGTWMTHGFWIPIVNEIWIPRAKLQIPKLRTPGEKKLSQIPESGLP